MAASSKFGHLRQAQYRAVAELQMCMRVARSVVVGKLVNYVRHLQEWGIRGPDIALLQEYQRRAVASEEYSWGLRPLRATWRLSKWRCWERRSSTLPEWPPCRYGERWSCKLAG